MTMNKPAHGGSAMTISKHALALCFALTFVAGAATATLAQRSLPEMYWYSGADIMRRPRPERTAYAAGAHDMLVAAVAISTHPDAHTAVLMLIESGTCLHRRAQDTLGTFTDWAETQWRGNSLPAAFLLFLAACRS